MSSVLPKLRFSHFNNEWSKRTFHSLVSRVSENTDLVDLPRVEFEDIVSGLGTLNKDITSKKSDKKGIKFNSEDILFGKLRPYLKNWLFADFQGIAIGDFWVLRPNNTDGYFIYALIQGPKYQRVANLSTGTKMPRSDWETVSKTKFSIPLHIEEQQKIGEFFKQLDDRIALQQRHVEQLKQSKQGFLQKMFPKDGESVPEVRFAGFSEEWSSQKIADLAPIRGGFAFKSSEFKDKGIPIIRISNIDADGSVKGEFVFSEEYTDDEMLTIHKGSAVIAMSGATTGKVAVLRNTNHKKLYQNQRVGYFQPKPFCDYAFLIALVKSNLFLKQLDEVLVAGAQPNISSKNIDNFSFLVPSLKEQQKIGEFFKQLDDLIAKNERELELLQETKKGFLQKMFV